MKSKGLIYDIKRFSVNDGPGIRTTVFFKGCQLSCWWCHNPESKKFEIETCIRENRVENKIFEQSVSVGKYYELNELMKEIEKDFIFYDESNGGVTFSGGEPLLQISFLTKLSQACRNRGIHTCLDTSGHLLPVIFETVISEFDLFLFDLKHLNDNEHDKYTGVSSLYIIQNLKQLSEKNKKTIVRFPVIQGINDTKVNIDEMKKLLAQIKTDNLNQIDLLPFHNIANHKYIKFNEINKLKDLKSLPPKDVLWIKNEFEEIGFKVTIGG